MGVVRQGYSAGCSRPARVDSDMITHLAVSHPCVFSSQLCHAVQRFGTLLDEIKLPGKELKDIFFRLCVHVHVPAADEV